jgi:hypothetical protein
MLLTLGILMIVGGWGTTQYTEARQAGLCDRSRDRAWRGEGPYFSGWVIFAGGILTMAAGTIIVVFSRD